ncbi:MAG: hypothetical protein HYY01_03300 [Chloroflexi bacterium]|nr:hypothetical protein [Chloroflexota bacterium]
MTTQEELIWDLQAEQFAVRLRDRAMEGIIGKRARVREGKVALLYLDEKFDRNLGPGVYPMGTTVPLLGTAKHKAVVIAQAMPVVLDFSLLRLLTRDPLYTNFDCRLQVRVQPDRENIFVASLMRDVDQVNISDLKALLFPELKDLAAQIVGRYAVKELAENLKLRDEFGHEIEAYLSRTFDGNALSFAGAQTANFRCEAWDKATNTKAEYFLQVTQEEAEIQGRKRLLEVLTEKELQSLIEETEKVAIYEKRALVWDRMRHATNSDKMAQVRSESELAEFMRQTDRDKLLKDSDLEEFKKALAATGEDKDRLRAHMARIAEMNRDQELQALELTQRTDLSRQEIEAEIGLARLRMEQSLEMELRRVDLEVEKRRHINDHRRAQEALDAAAVREAELAEARKQADIHGIGRETQRLDAELALALEEKKRAQERLHVSEMRRIQFETEERQTDLQLKKQEALVELRLRELKERHQREMENMQVTGTLPLHALIAVSSPDKAPLLSELARTQAMQGMSPEQILALAAEKNPQVTTAIAELAARSRSPEEKAMYERLLTEQKEWAGQTRQTFQDFQKTQQEMFNKALETMRDTATAFAKGQGTPPQTIVVGPSGATTVGGPPAAPQRVVVCRHCHQESPVGTKHCPNCGDSLMAER